MTSLPAPSSVEAEEALIGSILTDGGLYTLVGVHPDDFYIHRHRYIWQAITQLSQRGQSIDIITVQDELDKMNRLKDIGGASGLTKLVTAAADIYSYATYADIVRDKAARRKQITIANGLVQNALNGGVDVASVIDALSDSTNMDRAGRHVSQGLSQLYDTVEERAKNPQDVWGIPSGFLDLDHKTGGIHPEQTLMISGTSGVGKTTLMLQIALNAAKAGRGVAVFEAEMDEQRCIRRLVEIHTRGKVTNRMMLTGHMTDSAWQPYLDAIETIRKLPLYINDDPAIDTAKIRTEVARLKARQNVELICLDYINLLKDRAGDGRDTNENITTKSRRFREVCRSLHVAGLTIQSMTKEGMKATIPHLADMSGPAEVHFGADTIFFLVQDEQEPSLYRLLPAKQRDGDSGSAPIKLVRTGLAFYNAETRHLS